MKRIITEIGDLFRKLYFFCIPTSDGRMRYLKKHQVFDAIGENCFFQPRVLPADPKFIRFHNNVAVAANVTFVNHDVIYLVLRQLDWDYDMETVGCIEVMDNVFIGLGSIILPDVKIGPNAIVAAGSVVTKDVPPGTVVGGCPAKVIGSFPAIKEKRLAEAAIRKEAHVEGRTLERAMFEWQQFEKKRDSE